jgi:hypothetical protein
VASVSRKLGHTGTEMALNHYLDKDVVAQVKRELGRVSRWDPKKGEGPRRSHGLGAGGGVKPQKHKSPGRTGASECGRGESNSHSITTTRT